MPSALRSSVVALVGVVGLAGLVDQLVELRILEAVVVAGGHRGVAEWKHFSAPSGSGPVGSTGYRPGTHPCAQVSTSTATSTCFTFTLMPTLASIGITASTIGRPQLSFWLVVHSNSKPFG